MHRKFRNALLNKGYDIELENKPLEEHLAGYEDSNGVWHQQGLTPDQLKELSTKICSHLLHTVAGEFLLVLGNVIHTEC